jgi:putative membrane-bound dehydrogenase-like protein
MLGCSLANLALCQETERLGAIPAPADSPPLTPLESLAAIHVKNGYDIQLVVSEPLVQDPVAIDWGLDGALWVAEMADYPDGMDGQGKPGGRVRVLRDTDGDGRYDRSTVFLDGLSFPNGLITWGEGVLVTAAPSIVFAADRDGDDRADVTETMYSGFLEGNQQLRINGLRWGLDNWIYCASGSHHPGYGAERRVKLDRLGTDVVLGSRDFRIRPTSGELEPESGPSQFGRNANDWGDWFGVQNSYPLWHYVLADRYLRRNPYYAPADPRHQLVLPINPPVFPAKAPEKRYHGPEMAGHFTSACSGMVYRDRQLFADGDEVQHGFTCEPFHNLVQHHVVRRAGVSYTASRAEDEPELDFFASRDRWCRPVMVRTGPDGALWVVDMYRYMIEHPEWLPPEGKEELRPYYRSGEGLGRIYRIVPTRTAEFSKWYLSATDLRQLVAALGSTNGWLRDKAQQTLVAQMPLQEDIIKSLNEMVTGHPEALARMHALCTLDGVDQLNELALRHALRDPHWAVRRQAIRVAEQRRLQWGWIVDELIGLADESDPAVALQLACSLGELDSAHTGPPLARLGRQHADPYLRDAILSSMSVDRMESFLQELTRLEAVDGLGEWIQALSRMAAVSGEEAILNILLRTLLERHDTEPWQTWQWQGIAELADAWEVAGKSFDRWSEHALPNGTRWLNMIEQARQDLNDSARPSELKTQMQQVRLLDRQPEQVGRDRQLLASYLEPQRPVELQTAIVMHLARRPAGDLPRLLLSGWKQHSPVVRKVIVESLLQRPAWSVKLLEACREGVVAARDLSVSQRQSLMASRNTELKQLAEELFQQSMSAPRGEVVERYRAALAQPGDALRGKAVFAKTCAACHRLEDVGNEVGPNLRALTDRSPETLLLSILDPNRAVEPQYLSYSVSLQDGSIHSGMIAIETATSVTLRLADGKSLVLLREMLEEVQATGKSLMPEGLEQEIKPEEMRDLLFYLEGTGT